MGRSVVACAAGNGGVLPPLTPSYASSSVGAGHLGAVPAPEPLAALGPRRVPALASSLRGPEPPSACSSLPGKRAVNRRGHCSDALAGV